MTCSGLGRYRAEKAKTEGNWRCTRCELDETLVDGVDSGQEAPSTGGVTSEEGVESALERDERERQVLWESKAKEEVKEGRLCNTCKGRMKDPKVIPKCRTCLKYYHVSCAGVTRAELGGEVKRGRWRCSDCTRRAVAAAIEEAVIEAEEVPIGGKDRRLWSSHKRKSLRVLQWNADGLWPKKAELEELLVREEVDVACVQESKVGERTPVFVGYAVVKKERKVLRKAEEMRGGGLITLVRKGIPFRRLSGWKGKTTEGLSVAVDMSRRERLIVTNVYRPPIRRIEGEVL